MHKVFRLTRQTFFDVTVYKIKFTELTIGQQEKLS